MPRPQLYSASPAVNSNLFEREATLEIVLRLDLCDLGPLAASCSAVAASLRSLLDPFCPCRRAEADHMDLVCCVLRAALRSGELALESLWRANGKTVLSMAAGAGRPDVVRWLLLCAPEREPVDKPDSMGVSALHYAAVGGHEHCCELLLAHGATADLQDVNGLTPLHLAAEHGCIAACKVLLDNGAEVDARDSDGATPLLLAVQEGLCDVCRLLASRNADPRARNRCGESALSVAHQSASPELQRALEVAVWKPQRPCADMVFVQGPEALEIMHRAMRLR